MEQPFLACTAGCWDAVPLSCVACLPGDCMYRRILGEGTAHSVYCVGARSQNIFGAHKKDSRPVTFPEILPCMRSGVYQLGALVRHIGSSLHSGHYIIHVYLRGARSGAPVYAECNDGRIREHGFDRFNEADVCMQVYCLVYFRVSFSSPDQDDGVLRTPYRREAGSEALSPLEVPSPQVHRPSRTLKRQPSYSERLPTGVPFPRHVPDPMSASSSSAVGLHDSLMSSEQTPSSRSGAPALGTETASTLTASSSTLPIHPERELSRKPSYHESRDPVLPGEPLPPRLDLPTIMEVDSPLSSSRGQVPLLDPQVCAHPTDVSASSPSCPAQPGAYATQTAPSVGPCASQPDSARPSEAELRSFFCLPAVDTSKCMARLVVKGSVRQCNRAPVRGLDVCSSHKKKSRFGLLSGPLPDDVVPELSLLWNQQFLRPESQPTPVARASRGSFDTTHNTRSRVASPSVLDTSQSASSAISSPTASGPVPVVVRVARLPPAPRPRVVTGFGMERVDDVLEDERRRISEGAERGDRRREAGDRGRMRDLHGGDLDRSAGGAWHAGRR